MVSSRSAGSLPSVTAPKCGQDIGPQPGFLPTPDPLQVLPSGYSAWDEVGRDLPKLLAAGRARTVLEHLPILDADGLPDEAVHRAMLLLSFFGHAYVHQTWRTTSAQRLPSAREGAPGAARILPVGAHIAQVSRPGAAYAAYLIWCPEIARATTRRWISEVPSKIV